MRFARPPLDIAQVRGTLPILFAPVAQLDRASDYGSEGCVFESRRVQCQRVRGSPWEVYHIDGKNATALSNRLRNGLRGYNRRSTLTP